MVSLVDSLVSESSSSAADISLNLEQKTALLEFRTTWQAAFDFL